MPGDDRSKSSLFSPLAQAIGYLKSIQRCGRHVDMPDDMWFELQFKREEARKLYGIDLPGLPPDDVQKRFTGSCGTENLLQAFSFYRYVRAICNLNKNRNVKILDFGGGWGRIARFFLRDTLPKNIYISDCLTDSIEWLLSTSNPCNVVKNDPLPPINGLAGKRFDVIYAYSVFSHLSEEYTCPWISYLLDLLQPKGHLIFTTRGLRFIESVKELHESQQPSCLREMLPLPNVMQDRYMNGEFQFYAVGGGGELTADFYGETLIPKDYFETHYRSCLVDFVDELPHVDQCVVVLTKPRK